MVLNSVLKCGAGIAAAHVVGVEAADFYSEIPQTAGGADTEPCPEGSPIADKNLCIAAGYDLGILANGAADFGVMDDSNHPSGCFVAIDQVRWNTFAGTSAVVAEGMKVICKNDDVTCEDPVVDTWNGNHGVSVECHGTHEDDHEYKHTLHWENLPETNEPLFDEDASVQAARQVFPCTEIDTVKYGDVCHPSSTGNPGSEPLAENAALYFTASDDKEDREDKCCRYVCDSLVDICGVAYVTVYQPLGMINVFVPTVSCPEGSSPITTAAECQSAITSEFPSADPVDELVTQRYPTGCSYNSSTSYSAFNTGGGIDVGYNTTVLCASDSGEHGTLKTGEWGSLSDSESTILETCCSDPQPPTLCQDTNATNEGVGETCEYKCSEFSKYYCGYSSWRRPGNVLVNTTFSATDVQSSGTPEELFPDTVAIQTQCCPTGNGAGGKAIHSCRQFQSCEAGKRPLHHTRDSYLQGELDIIGAKARCCDNAIFCDDRSDYSCFAYLNCKDENLYAAGTACGPEIV